MKHCVIGLLVCLCLVSTTFARGRRSSPSYSTPSVASEPVPALEPVDDPEETEAALLNAINAERKRYGLLPLIMDKWLQNRARRHCAWMANNYSMVHSRGAAENIAMGYSSIDAVVQGWMNSNGHRANILNGGHVRTGIVGYRAPNGTTYWCQQFSR